MFEKYKGGIPRLDIDKLVKYRKSNNKPSHEYKKKDIKDLDDVQIKILATLLDKHYAGVRTPYKNVVEDFAKILYYLESTDEIEEYYI